MTTTLKELPLSSVKPDPNNPRKGKSDVTDLMKSIAEIGLIEPIVVRPIGSEYVVVAGHRRLAAMKRLKDEKTITALVVTDYDDVGALRDAVAENTVRQALSAVDEANAMVQLSGMGMTDEEIAVTFARDAKAVAAAKAINEATDKGAAALENVEPAEGVQLSLEQAAAIATFGGTNAGRQLVLEIQNGSRYWRATYEKLQRSHAINEDARAITKKHKGVKKIAAWTGSWDGPPKEIEPLVNLTDAKGKALTTAGHKSCPGHAYSVAKPDTWSHSTLKCTVAYWCTDWKANGHKVAKEPKRKWSQRGKVANGATKPSDEVIAEERALDEAWGEATARREAFIAEFVEKAKTGEKWILTAFAFCIEEGTTPNDGWEKLSVKELVKAIIKAYVEDREEYYMSDWRWNRWNRTEPVELLTFLAENGHELSDAEKKAIERAGAGIEAQTQRGKENAADDEGYEEQPVIDEDDEYEEDE